MRLNVGCGLDVRDGWTNIDTRPARFETIEEGFEYGDARDLSRFAGLCDVVLLNHVLHLFDYDDAERVLDECLRALAPAGRLIVVEPDVLRVVRLVAAHDVSTNEMLDRLTGEVEPTCDGQLLRWITWHGTRRSLWSPDSLAERMERRGLLAFRSPNDHAYVVDKLVEDAAPFGREGESFVVVGTRP